MDHFDGCNELLSDDEIIANITEKEYEVDENTFKEDEPSPYISHQTAHEIFTKCIEWYEK